MECYYILPPTSTRFSTFLIVRHLSYSEMVLELGGFIEPVEQPGFQSFPYSQKLAVQITRDDVILFDSRPHKVLDVLYTDQLFATVTITAYDAWRNATVQIKFLNPTEILDVVRTKVWEYLVVGYNVVTASLVTDFRLTPSLQREVDGTILGKKSDDTEVTFRIPGDQSSVTLGPFFRLVEGSGASIGVSKELRGYTTLMNHSSLDDIRSSGQISGRRFLGRVLGIVVRLALNRLQCYD